MSAPIEVVISSDASGQMWNSCVWDLESGTSLINYKGGSTSPRGLCLLGNQYLIGAVNGKPLIHVWALQRRDQQQIKLVCPGKVTSLAVSPEGLYCVAAVAEKIHVWQVCSGRLLAVLSRHYQNISNIKFTDNGSHFVTGGDDNLVIAWSLIRVLSDTDGVSQHSEPEYVWSQHSLPITDLYVGYGGPRARVVSSSLDQTCKVFDLVSGQLLCSFVFDVSIMSISMDHTEFRLFAGGIDGNIYLVNLYGVPVQRERHIQSTDTSVTCFKGHSKQVCCLSVSLDGTKLASGSHDCSVKIWDVFSGQSIRTLSHKGAVSNILLVPTPPSIANPDLKPAISIKPFQRHLHSTQEDRGNNSDGDMLEWRIQNTSLMENICNGPDSSAAEMLNEDVEEPHLNLGAELAQTKQEVMKLKTVNRELYQFAVNEILLGSDKIS
ncbi:hypothetical protein CHS0354_034010 [Potamilus streckersoni]|uniref:WD repeat-containing protein 18 n=1 Tax=Potamilus streckersoni TaxID=2493646 RepID=A0AAE0RMV9_9BIVA|nr:hypothetical protein CHS0354_034010 [Potamilus streckersoni]